MLDRIKQLEAIARQLQPDEDRRSELTQAASDYVNAFIKGLGEAPAANFTEDNGIGLYDSPISEDPIDIEAALSLFDQNVIRQGINTSSGRFIAYIPGGGLYYSALGDYLAAATNRFSGLFFASPGAVRMENMLTRWMAGVVGYPEDCGATLTSGGTGNIVEA